jgi:hypothetical protein
VQEAVFVIGDLVYGKRSDDLLVFKLNHFIVLIAICMVVCQDLKSLFWTVFTDVETGLSGINFTTLGIMIVNTACSRLGALQA